MDGGAAIDSIGFFVGLRLFGVGRLFADLFSETLNAPFAQLAKPPFPALPGCCHLVGRYGCPEDVLEIGAQFVEVGTIKLLSSAILVTTYSLSWAETSLASAARPSALIQLLCCRRLQSRGRPVCFASDGRLWTQ